MFDENRIENEDESHFVFNMDNGKTLGFKGDNDVKYADFISGGEPITMMVRVKGGANAQIEVPMLIFKKRNRSYPVQGVFGDVPGICYQSGYKGWMDGQVFKEWLSERREIKDLPNWQQRVLFVR